MMKEIRKKVRETQPLIHCITNPISIHQCANGILAVGARPIMAEHPAEVQEITKTAKALMVNLGNITDVRMESMQIAAKAAQKEKIPMIFDAVGVACSELRRTFAKNFLQNFHPAVIKGNYSEIRALYEAEYRASGVDAEDLSKEQICKIAQELAKKHDAIILASGKTDLIADKKTVIYVDNGSSRLASVTGTGCMQGALCASFLAVDTSIYAVATACVVLGISGELAAEETVGTGSFMVHLMDRISTLQDEEIEKRIKMEVKTIE